MSNNESFPGSWRPNPHSSVPLFDQLRLQVIDQTDRGTLVAGTRLPAVRSLAESLGVAPHTVARAYKELEAAGVVLTRGRNGTVVCAQDIRWVALSAAASEFSGVAKAQGASFAQAVQLFAAAYDDE